MGKIRSRMPSGTSIDWNPPKLNKRGRDGVRYWLEKFKAVLMKNLEGSRSGREYPLPGGGTYIASAPGEYPAKRLGELRNTIRVVMRTNKNGTKAVIGTDALHGLILEKRFAEGKKGGRAWLTRAYRENRKWLNKGLKRQFKKKQ